MSLRVEAEQFRKDNPRVEQLVERFAQEAINHGYESYGIATIWERIRWEISMEVPRGEAPFKMPNNHRAYYARWWLEKHPDYPKFFQVCELRSERGGDTDRWGRTMEAEMGL